MNRANKKKWFFLSFKYHSTVIYHEHKVIITIILSIMLKNTIAYLQHEDKMSKSPPDFGRNGSRVHFPIRKQFYIIT